MKACSCVRERLTKMASLAWCELHIVIIDEKMACPAFSVRLHDVQGRVEAYFCLDFLFLFHRRKKKIKIGKSLFCVTQFSSIYYFDIQTVIFIFFLEKKNEKNRAGLLADPSRLDSEKIWNSTLYWVLLTHMHYKIISFSHLKNHDYIFFSAVFTGWVPRLRSPMHNVPLLVYHVQGKIIPINLHLAATTAL